MNDKLQGVLAELASSLGTSAGELWAWLQGDGVQAYASVQVARLTVSALAGGVALALILVVMLAVWRHCAKDKYLDGVDLMLAEMLPGFVLLLVGMFETVVVSDLVGWMASPEGMVLMKVMEALQG